MTGLASALQLEPLPDTIVNLLRTSFTNPQQLLTVQEWQNGGTASYVVQQIYKERLKTNTAGPFDEAAANLLKKWTQHPPVQDAEASAARSYLVFLAYAKPPGVRATLELLIDQQTTRPANLDWFARLLTLLQDYERTSASPKRRLFEFWEEHIHTFDQDPKYISVVWSGMLRRDKDRAFQLFPKLATTSEAADSLADLFRWVAKHHVHGELELQEKLASLDSELKDEVKDRLNSWFTSRRICPPWSDRLSELEIEVLIPELDDISLVALLKKTREVAKAMPPIYGKSPDVRTNNVHCLEKFIGKLAAVHKILKLRDKLELASDAKRIGHEAETMAMGGSRGAAVERLRKSGRALGVGGNILEATIML